MTIKSSLMLSGLLLWAANGGAGEIRPQGVSPGADGPVSLIESRCSTFSWSLVPGARAYELAVFEVNPKLLEGDLSDAQTGEPRVRVRLPGMAVSWTPSVGQCLERGGQYAWFVRALGDEWGEWSEAKVFEVASGPSIVEVEEAMRVLRRYTETRQDALGRHRAAAEPDRPRERSARRRGVAEPEGSRGPLSGPGAAGSRKKWLRPGEEMRDGPGNRLAEAIEVEPEWTPSLESVAAEAAAPTLATPSLTLDRDMSLAGGSSVFKDGVVFLWDDTTGNTALGRDALASATGTATSNTAVGERALRNATGGIYSFQGSSNTAVGHHALYSNTTGAWNTAFGGHALSSNTTGFRNAASGLLALASNTTGFYNTAMGMEALSRSGEGWDNTAVGTRALKYLDFGYDNVAIGSHAHISMTNGSKNTALGASALRNHIVGYSNIAIGYKAGGNLGNGSYNIFIGHEGVDGDSYTIRIGGSQTHTYIDGIRGETVSGNTVYVDSAGRLGTASSARRFKEEIRDMDEASSALLALRPVTFRYRPEVFEGTRPIEFGLLAEEVAELYPDLVTYDEEGQPLAVRYQVLIPMLLNELQRQQRQIQELTARAGRLKDP